MEPLDFSQNLKSLLLERLEWFENRQLEVLNRFGLQQLTIAQGRVFAQLKGKDLNISELAKRLGVSRQAAQKTVASLVEMRLLQLGESADNLSAKVVHITEQGHQFRQQIGNAMDEVEAQISLNIGKQHIEQLKALLQLKWD
jgi:DNA-binding MarR family transcriptional regulator